jgi:asparagine synthase (glutamine-hydrolysing)
MCGICGVLAPPGGEPEPALVDRMRGAIVHRGPDDGGTDRFGRCVLGHRRLSIIDLDTGNQPLFSESGAVAVVFNGELYNFRELRAELEAKGHELRGTGDTAVIPHLYEEHGVDFVKRLKGMFAVALWDGSRERLVLARDRIGKKPLLWTVLRDGTLAWASELKALAQLPGLPRDVDLGALDAYLSLQYVPDPQTALRDVRRLPPAHVLVAERGGEPRVERYWRLEPAALSLSEDEWLERVREEVRGAVRRRLIADVPLGALLSGGIDSSVIVGLMAQESAGPVRTFTIGFSDARYDEREYARAVAERWSTQHEELVAEPHVDELLPRLAWTFDEPFGDASALPTYLVCELARRRITVALAGDGGDEAFAGYERYLAHGLADRLSWLPGTGAAARALRALPGGRTDLRAPLVRAARFLDVVGTPAGARYGRMMEIFPVGLRRELWTDDALAEIGDPPSAAELLGAPRLRGTAGLQLLDAETYLPGDLLRKADLASMAHSLELRAPLLDTDVLELTLALPDALRTSGRRGKVALRRAFADLLPEPVAARGKKGFGVPLAAWFRGDLQDLTRDLLLDSRARSRGWFRPAAVERLVADHVSGRADHGHRLWCLVMLELWQRLWVEGAAPPQSPADAEPAVAA